MMRFKLVFVYFNTIFFISCVLGKVPLRDDKQKRLDVSLYYQNVFKAESYVVKKQYYKATESFKKAFATGITFSRDLRNAVSASLLSNKNDSTFIVYSLTRLRESCDSSHFFSKIITDDIKELLLEKKYYEFLTKLSSLKPKYNKSLRDKIIKIHKRDQGIRNECAKKSMDFYNDPICRSKIIAGDSLNQSILINLYKKHNNITEWDIGIDYYSTIMLVVLHNSAWQNYDLQPILLEQTLKGFYPNRVYANLIDRNRENIPNHKWNPSTSYGTTEAFKVNNKYIVPFYNDTIISSINQNREEIYLNDYIEYYYNQGKLFEEGNKFFSIGMIFSWGRVSQERYDSMINSYLKNDIELRIYSNK